MSQDLLTLKITITSLIFLFASSGVLSPRLLNPFGNKISYLNLIAAGVIIAAALVHLLSNVSQNIFVMEGTDTNNPYPWSFFISGLSFLMLFCFERLLVHQLLSQQTDQIPAKEDEPGRKELISISVQESTPLDNIHDHHTSDILHVFQEKNYFTAIILLFGLGLHSFLSGLAIGSTQSSSQVIVLGICLLSHKFLAAFALGSSLYKSSIGESLLFSIFISISYGLLTPIGAVIGWWLQSIFNMFISDIFVCIATGTFLYVAICDIMIPEFSEEKQIERKVYQSISNGDNITKELTSNNNKEDYKKMLCVLFGFGIMSLLRIWIC